MMPSLLERDTARDTERQLSHKHSVSSDQGRALIPMWDSSDPDRAPPPLPLNPQSPTVSPRKGTSSAIQSAHANLAERARESSGSGSGSLAKRQADMSPEKSLVKSTHHRRMQSLHNGTVRDMSMLLESGVQPQSPSTQPKSPEKTIRPSTPARAAEGTGDSRPTERDVFIASPVPGPSLTPIVRPTVRRPQQSILGENTPPQSATMLALQNIPGQPPRVLDTPLSNITNSVVNQSNPAGGPTKIMPNIDGLSNQILSLTSIATALQKDIAQLSRRSRDNATDLLSLKEATNARDEDIRRSLREVITNFHESPRPSSRDPYNAGLLLDTKPHQNVASPHSKAARPFSLPRIPSLTSFAASIDRDSVNTPQLCAQDTTGTMAILEKILKDMGTKQGNELLLGRLAQISDRLSGLASAGSVEELLAMAKKNSHQAIVPHRSQDGDNPKDQSLGLKSDPFSELITHGRDGAAGLVTQRVETLLRNENGQRSSVSFANDRSNIVNDDVVKIIHSIKDSVSQSGGLTAEVKALVRELRGEVLGMGREIGRKLELASQDDQRDHHPPSQAEISRIVDEGLEQLKDQMDQLIEAHRRQIAEGTSTTADVIDYQEVYNAMRAAIRDSSASDASRSQIPSLNKADVVEAIRGVWEEYRPEIEGLGHGIAKEEVLDFLKEGLQDYLSADERMPGATREEVFQAVVEGLKHFVPPRMDSPASLSRDEILDAVRECLEEFEFPVAPSAINAELNRDDMIHAFRECLSDFESKNAITRHANATASSTDDIATRLDDIAEYIGREFKTVSEEAKQNMAANGRDTEQVLDATKDGLEKLRADLEQFIHQATTQTPPAPSPDLLATVSRILDAFREDIASLLAKSTEDSRLLVEERLATIHETVNSSMVPATPQTSHVEVLDAVKNGVDALRAEMRRPLAGTTEILDAMHEGLSDIRISVDKIGNRPADLTANDEILEALRSGLDGVRSDIDGLREQGREINAITAMNDNAVIPAEPQDLLRHDDIKNLEILITQLRIKVEAMSPDSEPTIAGDVASKDDISRLEEMLGHITESVSGLKSEQSPRPSAIDPATREDVEAIETILRNTKARLDDIIDGDIAVRKEHIDSLYTLLEETRGTIRTYGDKFDDLPHKDQLASLEVSVAKVATGIDEMKDRALQGLEDPERVTKVNIEAVENLCREIKVAIDDSLRADLGALASGEDVEMVTASLEELKERMGALDELSTKAFEERQAEIVGVSERVTDVRGLVEEFQEFAKSKLEEGATGIDALGKLLEGIQEAISQNSTLGQDLKDLSELMKMEFEESKAAVVGAKLDADEKLQHFNDGLALKIDEQAAQLLSRYDELQAAADERAKAGEARDLETEQALLGTKTVADELKSLVDTLGVAVTDSMEKSEEASKTVFNRVEELMIRTEENHIDDKSEHQQTRDKVKVAADAVECLQSQVGEFQPKVLEAVKDLLHIVGQHYEHSKASTAEIESKIITTQLKAEPPLLPPVETYDDTTMQEKLDRLVGHTVTAERAFGQLDTLEQVHRQVTQTASEISAFLADHTRQIADFSTDRERALQESSIALERQLVQKEQVEASLVTLRDEEDQLKQSILRMKAEHEAMARHKTKMTADVSSLETALRLRREELQDMENRAEGLERRILEGVMDHSRVLLMSKAARNQEAMSRKRVKTPKPGPVAVSPNEVSQPRVPITLATKRNLAPPGQSPQARRILSLSQIHNNTVASGMKRSQSVRTPAAQSLRKSSWAGGIRKDGNGPDKENSSGGGIDEESESDMQETHTSPRKLPTIDGSTLDDDDDSEPDTLRRSSHGTTIITESLADDSMLDGNDCDTELGYDDDRQSIYTHSITGSVADDGVLGNEIVIYGEGAAA